MLNDVSEPWVSLSKHENCIQMVLKVKKTQKESHSGGQNEGHQSVEKAAQKESVTLLQMVLLVEKEHFLGIH